MQIANKRDATATAAWKPSTALKEEEYISFLFHNKTIHVPRSFVMKEHPGGKHVLLPYEGKDIAEAFAEADHSFDAKEMVEEWEVSTGRSQVEADALKQREDERRKTNDEWRWRSTAIAFGVATIVAALVLRPSR